MKSMRHAQHHVSPGISDQLVLSFVCCEQNIRAQIISLSAHALVILVEESLVPFSMDTVMPPAILNWGEQQWTLQAMMVVKVLERGAGSYEVWLGSGASEQNKAMFWEIYYRLRQQTEDDVDSYDALNLPKIPARGLYTEEARQQRLEFIRAETQAALTEVCRTQLDPRKLVSNIEGLIGSVEIPVGVAGPLHIRGNHAKGLFYAPLATSEGALVASATRGATALSRSGGVSTRVLGQHMMRVPVFVFDTMSNAMFFADWVKDQFELLVREARRYSNYAELQSVQAYVLGRNVHVYLIYRTGDAAGQNMTTTCSWQICQWILKSLQKFKGLTVENFLIEANLSNDKKVTYQSFLRGRGIRVVSESVLTAEACKQVLKVEPAQLVSAYNYMLAGSIAAGMIGMNVNVANIIAAMFTSLGQDIACVHESSLAQLHIELNEAGDVYCTMMLPSLVIGTVGGGTNLVQQRECLEMLGCAGPGKAHKLAEIIAAYCLALDLSTLSAIASDQFARAHEKLGRNRPVEHLKWVDLTPEFFSTILGEEVREVEAHPQQSTGSSIITELTSHKVNKLIGLFPMSLHTQTGVRDVMLKIKPLDQEVILMMNSMASMCNPRLAQEFNKFKDHLGFRGCHIRELAILGASDERMRPYVPKIHGVFRQDDREIFMLVEENLRDLLFMDSADDTSSWRPVHIQAAICGISEIHSIWYGREAELIQQPWLTEFPTRAGMLEKQRLWELLGVHAREEFPEWFSEEDLELYQAILHEIDHWWAEIEKMPRTLIHNDFNPRNLAFRKDSEQSLRLCVYDWELATLHLPQHDLVELLGFTLFDPIDPADVDRYIELHRSELERHSGRSIDPLIWRQGYRLALMDILVNRMPLYMMAHTFRHYPFMERVYRAFRNLLSLEGFL